MTRAIRYILTAQKRNETLTYTGTLEEILNELEDQAQTFNDPCLFSRSTCDLINLERDCGNEEAAFYSYDNSDEGEKLEDEILHLWFSDEHPGTKAAQGFMNRVAGILEATETYQRYLEVDDGEEERDKLAIMTLRARPLMLTPDTLCAYAEYVLDTPMTLINCAPVEEK